MFFLCVVLLCDDGLQSTLAEVACVAVDIGDAHAIEIDNRQMLDATTHYFIWGAKVLSTKSMVRISERKTKQLLV